MKKMYGPMLLFFLSFSMTAMDYQRMCETADNNQKKKAKKNNDEILPKSHSSYLQNVFSKSNSDEELPLTTRSDPHLKKSPKTKTSQKKKTKRISQEKKHLLPIDQSPTIEPIEEIFLLNEGEVEHIGYENTLAGRPPLNKQKSVSNVKKKFSFRKPKNNVVVVPTLSDDEILFHILTNNVSVLKKQKILPEKIKEKSLSEWAYLGGSYDLAAALNPKSVGRYFLWSSAESAALRLKQAKRDLFLYAAYGDLTGIENAKMTLKNFHPNIINERFETPALVAEKIGYTELAKHLAGETLTPETRKNILKQCLEINKRLLLLGHDDEKHHWLSWDVAQNARKLIANEFSGTFIHWLSVNNFEFSLTRRKGKVIDVEKIRFHTSEWNLLDREKLLLSKAVFENDRERALENLTADKKKELTTELFVELMFFEESTSKISDVINSFDKLIQAGADLEAKCQYKKKGPRSVSEWANALELRSLSLALSNKYVWFLFDKKKLIDFLKKKIFENSVKNNDFYL